MDYTEMGCVQLLIGGVIVASGSVLSTLGWNWSSKHEKARYKAWWLLIIVGFILAGGGAIFTTWGWDNINKQGKKEALLYALIQETSENIYHARTYPLDPNEWTAEKAQLHTLLPSFEWTAGYEVYVSDLIKDGELIDKVLNYKKNAKVCNDIFRINDHQLVRTVVSSDTRLKVYKDLHENLQPLQTYRAILIDMLFYFQVNYKKQFELAMPNSGNRLKENISSDK